MRKNILAEKVALETGLTCVKVKEVLNAAFRIITDGLVEDKLVTLTGFGVFRLRYRSSRIGWNPKKQTYQPLKAKYSVKFRPCKMMNVRVKEMEVTEEKENGKENGNAS